MADILFQHSLFQPREVGFDSSFARLERVVLPPLADAPGECWVEYAPGWVSGADLLFEQILAARKWGQRTRWMYEKRVREPRLTAPWNVGSGLPLEPAVIDEMRRCLSERYGVVFDQIGFNLYRDGADSVAWHVDHIAKEVVDPVIAIVSVGEPRKFLLRPRGGGASRPYLLGRGDLIVSGGKTNRLWEHTIPKVARAGPRISLAFRYGLDPGAYSHKKTVEPDRTIG